jgi:hypothetical protein
MIKKEVQQKLLSAYKDGYQKGFESATAELELVEDSTSLNLIFTWFNELNKNNMYLILFILVCLFLLIAILYKVRK